jgi:hypothetical protein
MGVGIKDCIVLQSLSYSYSHPPSRSFGRCYGVISAIHSCFEGHSPSIARIVVFHLGASTPPHRGILAKGHYLFFTDR